MSRLAVVTGSAGGIGAATVSTLEAEGYEVVGVDIADAEIIGDVSTSVGRAQMIADVADRTNGVIDVVVANAGVMGAAGPCISINYFGAIATLEGLRPYLARGEQPRAIATVSSSILNIQLPAVVEACLADDEDEALRLVVELPGGYDLAGYPTSKYALARWIRRTATTDDWAGAGIALNGVAPGIVRTPMTADMLADHDSKELADASVPMPFGGYCHPQHVADTIAFFASPRPTRICGQVLFIDAGADVELRGDDIWNTAAL